MATIEFDIDEFEWALLRRGDVPVGERAPRSYQLTRTLGAKHIYLTKTFSSGSVIYYAFGSDAALRVQRLSPCGCVSEWLRDRRFKTSKEAVAHARMLVTNGFEMIDKPPRHEPGSCWTHSWDGYDL
jgi:hypothetical protein